MRSSGDKRRSSSTSAASASSKLWKMRTTFSTPPSLTPVNQTGCSLGRAEENALPARSAPLASRVVRFAQPPVRSGTPAARASSIVIWPTGIGTTSSLSPACRAPEREGFPHTIDQGLYFRVGNEHGLSDEAVARSVGAGDGLHQELVGVH